MRCLRELEAVSLKINTLQAVFQVVVSCRNRLGIGGLLRLSVQENIEG